MIIVSKYLTPKNYSALTIYPFMILKHHHLKEDCFLIHHENIHITQQKELLWVFFFVAYFLEYAFQLIKYKNHHKAYRSISFEKEAYQNESNLNYLIERKRFSFINYF